MIMRLIRNLACVCAFAATLPAAFGGTSSPPPATVVEPGARVASVAEKLRPLLAAFQERTGFPGGGIGFVLPDGASGALAIGSADIENSVAMTVDHRLPAGSIGKTFFAAVALQLVAEAKLDLAAPISEYLGERDWFPRLPNAATITVRMLMNHTSGIPEHVTSPGFTKALHDQPDKAWTPDELIAFVLDKPPLFPAGEARHWSYADTNYIVLGMILEKVTGAMGGVYGLVRERLLQPLRLADTLPQDRPDLPGLACGYMKPGAALLEIENTRTLIEGRFFINPQFEWCGGGFVSTPRDLARWAHALWGSDAALKKDSLHLMLESVPARTGRDHRYGLGVQIRPTAHGLTRGHGGYFPGAMSEMIYLAEHGIALAIMVNSDHHTSPRTLLQCLDECAGAILAAAPAELMR